MTKIPCEIIRDLLPLYQDDICSEKSRIAIEGHMKECESCRKYLKKMECEIPIETDDAEKADEDWKGFREFSEKVSRKLNGRIIIVGGVIFLICVMLSVILFSDAFQSYHLSNIPVEDIKVEEVYQLKDGRLYVHLKSKRRITVQTYPQLVTETDLETGEASIGNIRKSNSTYEVSMGSSINPFSRVLYITSKEVAYIIPFENRQIVAENGTKVSEFYYAEKPSEKKILWQKNDKVKKAPERVEKFVKESLAKEDDDSENGNAAKILWVNPRMPIQ